MSPTTGLDSFMFAQVVPYRVAAREVFVPCYLLSPLLPHFCINFVLWFPFVKTSCILNLYYITVVKQTCC